MTEIEKMEKKMMAMKTALSKAKQLQEFSQDYGYHLAKQDYNTARKYQESINELVLEMRFAALGLGVDQ